jgi:hypothetical protein
MVAPMVRKLRFALPAACAAALLSCHRQPPEAQAAVAAQRLLSAAWSGDAAAFESGLDRPAVRADLRRQLAQVAQASTLAVEGGASDPALDRMITPSAFRLTDARGAPLAAAPSLAQVQPLVSPLGQDRACLHASAGPADCLLTFAHGPDGWRLTGMAPAGFTVALPPEPAKPD